MLKTRLCKFCNSSSNNVKWVTKYGVPEGRQCLSCCATRATSRAKEKAGTPERKAARKLANDKSRSTSEGKAKAQQASTAYIKNRRKTDPIFKLVDRLRGFVISGLSRQGYSKTSRTHEILGASFKEVMQYLNCPTGIPEGYELDHILPMALAYDEASAIKLNHYTNLQLLTKAANLEKRDKLADGRNARDLTLEEKKELILAFSISGTCNRLISEG